MPFEICTSVRPSKGRHGPEQVSQTSTVATICFPAKMLSSMRVRENVLAWAVWGSTNQGLGPLGSAKVNVPEPDGRTNGVRALQSGESWPATSRKPKVPGPKLGAR